MGTTTKTKAIVLHSLKYGDASLIVDVLTEELGRVSFMARIPKTSKARVKKQFFQPMTILDLEFDYRQRSSLQHIKDARIAIPYYNIPFDPVKSSVLLFVAEFLYSVTKDEQHNQSLFNYVVSSLQWYDASDSGFANFHLVFMMRLSRFIGFYPNLEDYVPGSCFDLRNGCFTTLAPLHSDVLQPEDAERISIMMRMDYENMRLFKLSRQDRNRFTDIALYYYRLHVPNMPELQSFEILKEIFGA